MSRPGGISVHMCGHCNPCAHEALIQAKVDKAGPEQNRCGSGEDSWVHVRGSECGRTGRALPSIGQGDVCVED